MYIPEFWVGVAATLFAELIVLVVATIVDQFNKNKKR